MTPDVEAVRPRPWGSPGRAAASAAAVLVGLALAVAVARANGLWADEFFSLAIATGHSLEHPAARAEASRGDFVEAPGAIAPSGYARYLDHESPPAGPNAVVRAALLSDTSPPLYYLSLWGWTRACGTGDLSLRLHSVAWWLACLGPLAAIARRVGGRGAVLPARAIFCLTPASLFFATEGRMYSMLWFWTLAVVATTLRLGRGPGRRPWGLAAAWVAASAAGFLTHYFFAFPWAACVAWLLLSPGRIGRAGVVGAVALVGAGVAPWYTHLPESLGAWRVTADWLKWRPGNYGLLRSYAAVAKAYFTPGGGGRQALAVAAAAAPLVVLIGWKARRRYRAWPALLLFAWVAASLAGPAVFDLLRGTYTIAVPRYAISRVPAAYLLVAAGVARLGAATRMAFVAAFLVPWAVGVRHLLTEDRAQEPARQVGALLAGDARDSDVVIVHSIPSCVAGVARALADGGGDASGVKLAAWVGQLGRRRVPEDLDAILAGRARARVVVIHAVGAPTPEADWLRDHARPVGELRLGNATVLDFAPARGARFGEAAQAPPESTPTPRELP